MEYRLRQILSDLVSIESVNPAYPGGDRGENAVAEFVEDHCRKMGLDVLRQSVLPGRDNVVAELCVPGATRSLLLEAHMDTVALEPMGQRGLKPEIRDGMLYGRGACDTKGSLAAMLGAMETLLKRRADLGINVLLLASVDEEDRYRGILSFIESGIPVDAAIVGEPTNLRVVVATKGCVRCRITTHGRSAHSSNPQKGENAIDRMADILLALREYQFDLTRRNHPLVGHPTMSVGRIWGGIGVNIVPDQCTIEIDRRLIPGEDPESALAEIDAVLSKVWDVPPGQRVSRGDPFIVDWALDTPLDSPIVVAGSLACQDLHCPSDPIGVAYGTDASKLSALARVPGIVFGPGSIEQAHTADEYVPISHLTTACEFYAHCALKLSAMSP